MLDITLPEAGTYAILASDFGANQTGNYSIVVQNGLNNPGNTVPIAFGETVSASISGLFEIDAYTFDGLAGDRIRIRMSDGSTSSFSIDNQIQLYDPARVELGSVVAEVEAVLDITLPESGSYLILASDFGADQTGNYSINLQRLNTFTFDGSADDNFNNPENWDTGSVPGANDVVLIPVDSGQVKLNDSLEVRSIVVSSESTLQVTPSATLTLNESISNVASGGSVLIDGALEVLASSSLIVDGTIENPGQLTLLSDVTGSGTIDNTSAMTVSSATLDVDLNNAGSVEINGTLMLTKASRGSGGYSLDAGDSLEFEDGLHQFEMTLNGPSSGTATVKIGTSASVMLGGGT